MQNSPNNQHKQTKLIQFYCDFANLPDSWNTFLVPPIPKTSELLTNCATVLKQHFKKGDKLRYSQIFRTA